MLKISTLINENNIRLTLEAHQEETQSGTHANSTELPANNLTRDLLNNEARPRIA